MNALIVVENTKRWPLHVPGVEVVPARTYLTDPRYSERRGIRVFNLCRTYSYQTLGYYVSLLAAARGHRPLPSVETIQDLRMPPMVRIVSEDLEELIERSLASLKSEEFTLSIYFGSNIAARYERLSRALFNMFPVPFLRATLKHDEGWSLTGIRAIATSEIPESHRAFVLERAAQYFASSSQPRRPKQRFRYELAILINPKEESPPSDDKAIRKFVRAAANVGINATLIEADDYGRLAEFDALFIRETTYVNHHTYRFARRAAAENMIVIDDPESIVRCTNKVYQAELFGRHKIPSPKTLVVHQGNIGAIEAGVGLPCVLKRPDSAFSQGVVKANDREELRAHVAAFLEDSDLVIAQAYVPSEFDWRIGVLDGKVLYASRYHMAKGHWQIIHKDAHGKMRYGKVETMMLEAVPSVCMETAVRAARLIGDGLYGVDIKEINGRYLVTEVNDNPTLEAGYEDRILKDELYLRIMLVFRERLDARGTSRDRR